jgi:hypothetical protein
MEDEFLDLVKNIISTGRVDVSKVPEPKILKESKKSKIAILEAQNKDLLDIIKNYKSTELPPRIIIDKENKLSLDQHDKEIRADERKKVVDKLMEFIIDAESRTRHIDTFGMLQELRDKLTETKEKK